MTEVTFELVDVPAMGKPRMTRNWWHKKTKAVVLKYNAWKDQVRLQMRQQNVDLPKDPVGLEFTVYIPMPPSWAKTKHQKYLLTFHDQKPDIDNIAKALMDCIFKEDKCVGVLKATKVWTGVHDKPSWSIKVWAPN